MIDIDIFPSGPFETNAIVLSFPETREALFIDPAPQSKAALLDHAEKNSLTVKAIFLTHSHWDHIADTAAVKENASVPVYIHPEDAANLRSPGSDGLPLFFPIKGVEPDKFFSDGEKFVFGNVGLEVLHTPGHTPGSVCFYIPEAKVLISGDTLFKGTIGNLSFPTSRPRKMWDSLLRLSKLPKETEVFPGHGGSTTIGEESWLAAPEKVFGKELFQL